MQQQSNVDCPAEGAATGQYDSDLGLARQRLIKSDGRYLLLYSFPAAEPLSPAQETRAAQKGSPADV